MRYGADTLRIRESSRSRIPRTSARSGCSRSWGCKRKACSCSKAKRAQRFCSHRRPRPKTRPRSPRNAWAAIHSAAAGAVQASAITGGPHARVHDRPQLGNAGHRRLVDTALGRGRPRGTAVCCPPDAAGDRRPGARARARLPRVAERANRCRAGRHRRARPRRQRHDTSSGPGSTRPRFYPSLDAMLDRAKPQAVVAFTSTADHPAVVEAVAPRKIP